MASKGGNFYNRKEEKGLLGEEQGTREKERTEECIVRENKRQLGTGIHMNVTRKPLTPHTNSKKCFKSISTNSGIRTAIIY